MAAELDSNFLFEKRYAVVTGANKGIGLEICRQLASKGVVVVLTARDENRGREALEKLKKENLPVEFHQLDVADPTRAASLADFIKTRFGKLDILVNNAGVSGIIVKNTDALRAVLMAIVTNQVPKDQINPDDILTQTYQMAEECININYYGAKRTTEALLPLLLSSDSGRILNVASKSGQLNNIPNEWARGILSNADDLNTEKVECVLGEFLKDFKEGKREEKGWPTFLSAYSLSKAAMNAYTRLMSKIHRSIDINSICPGYVKTDITYNDGIFSAEEGAEPIVRLALSSKGESSGLFMIREEVASF